MLATIRDCLEGLVHPSAQHDAPTAARHGAFIAPRLVGSVVALAALPLYFAIRGMPSLLELLIFAWLVVPVVVAYFLSRTGRYEYAYLLSALALTGLVTVVVSRTGGISSFAAVWFVIVPLEASLSGSRRVVLLASSLAFSAIGFLIIVGATGLLPPAGSWDHQLSALMALGVISSAFYVTGLAFGTEVFTRGFDTTGTGAAGHGAEDQLRVLVNNMTDVVTRHGNNGAVLFVSPTVEDMMEVRPVALLNHGLFERVLVADRPAYLKAIGDAAVLGGVHTAELRVRRQAPAAAGEAGGEFIWIELRCRPLDELASDHDRPQRRDVVAVLRDVTARKQQELTNSEAQAEAERINAAKSQFLATMKS